MPTKAIDVSKAKENLKELLSLALEGTEIILTENSEPIALLLPIIKPGNFRIAGLHLGAIWTRDDFDEPLDDEFWAGNS